MRTGDPITDLGCVLRRPIPKGRDRVEWMERPGVLEEVIGALRSVGYTGNLLARAVFDLTLGEVRLPLTIDTPAALEALDGVPGS